MTEIEEGNKLIAEFDGWYQDLNVNKGSDINWFHKDKSARITNELMLPRTPSGFKYHNSWDWLMPVVEKIEGENGYVDIANRDCEISPDWREYKKFSRQSKSKIEAVWLCVIDFIQWYNSLSSNKK